MVQARDDRRYNFGKELIGPADHRCFGRPFKIAQIWLPKLTINNNFSDVARFDRCTTCHQGLDKTAPGSAVEPAYQPKHPVTLQLATFSPAADAEASEPPSADALAELQEARHKEYDALRQPIPARRRPPNAWIAGSASGWPIGE